MVALICFGATSKAQDASGSCKLPGTYDYVSVDFYKGESRGMGNLTYSVQTNEFTSLNEVKVVVKASICTKKGSKDQNGNIKEESVWETCTLFDDKLRDIPANRTNTMDIKMPFYYAIKNITVTVNNPICK